MLAVRLTFLRFNEFRQNANSENFYSVMRSRRDLHLAFSLPESAFFDKSADGWQEVGGQGLVEEQQWLR